MFYYLNSRSEPCGPHRKEELFYMLKTGKLAACTLVAKDGGEAWEPLQQLYTQHRLTTRCPRCGADTAPAIAANAQVQPPLYCEHCHEQLRAAVPGNVLSNIAFALQHLFRFKGCATRAEFWSMLLLYIFLVPALLAGTIYLTIQYYGAAAGVVNSIITFCCCVWGALLIILAALCARRMRDAGFNASMAWWLLLYPMSPLCTYLSFTLYPHYHHPVHRALMSLSPFCLIMASFITLVILVRALYPTHNRP
ncbi:MAG: DUF805 domain-containing protein [Akkermansiaceae bacterium]|nr:DUF805 domain-containing protein [Akkermansiaceae bacterium]